MVLGTLIYSVVLGFFADYTGLLAIGTSSTIIAAAFVLQVLTFLTLLLKSVVLKAVRGRKLKYQKIAVVATIWPILFLSKFVFLWILETLFGADLDVSGFAGLMLIIATMTIAQAAINHFYVKLAELSE